MPKKVNPKTKFILAEIRPPPAHPFSSYRGLRVRIGLRGILATGLLSNQGEKSTNFYFIMVPLRKKY